MIPLALQPWIIKGGAIVLLLSVVFYGGCHTGKNMSQKKIQRLESKITRYVDIIDTFQENVDTLERAIDDQNEAIAKLGEEHNAKVVSMQASHEAAIRRLNTANNAAIRGAREEAAALRARMAQLSVGESCIEAMKAIAQ